MHFCNFLFDFYIYFYLALMCFYYSFSFSNFSTLTSTYFKLVSKATHPIFNSLVNSNDTGALKPHIPHNAPWNEFPLAAHCKTRNVVFSLSSGQKLRTSTYFMIKLIWQVKDIRPVILQYMALLWCLDVQPCNCDAQNLVISIPMWIP